MITILSRMRRGRRRWIRGCISLLILLFLVKLGKNVLDNNFPLLGAGETLADTDQNDPRDGNIEDQEWLLNIKTSRTDEIPTVIIEEHYEVLKYWFQAAELDLIPRSKNILLHIDAHVDGAVPYDVDSIPWFRFPSDRDEVYRMMQRNDMFIVAAAMTGFIDHFIWVWPMWDEGDEDWTHMKVDLEIGVAQTWSDTGHYVKKSFLCVCWRRESGSLKEKFEDSNWSCHIRNTTCVEGKECPRISRSSCLIHSQAVLEIVSESVARTVLAKEKWPADKGFILDIDEDFFGCWSDVIPLYEAGIVQANIDVLTDLVSNLFCVSTAEEEILVDRFYVAIISLIKKLKLKSCAVQEKALKKGTRCLRNVELDNFLIENEDMIMNFVKLKHSSKIMCESEEKIAGLFFQSLLHFFLNFSLEQLTLLEQLGICLKVSPASLDFDSVSGGRFHICHGDNIPNRTLIPFYLPEGKDIYRQVVSFKRILSSVSKAPNIITVSRSVRDGYTPKSLFPFIESVVLKGIERAYKRVNASNILYDSNLLGGKHGWTDRPQPMMSDLTEYLGLR